jgi:hypothetical protein
LIGAWGAAPAYPDSILFVQPFFSAFDLIDAGDAALLRLARAHA